MYQISNQILKMERNNKSDGYEIRTHAHISETWRIPLL